MMAAPAPDVLRWPVIGPFLRWRHARTSLQLVLLAAAAVVVLHGLFGPRIAPANLATVLTWVHYRGLLVVGLLAAGNFFCTGCPFVLLRDAGRRVRKPARAWPRWLRSKWPAIALIASVLFAYELFDLWALPRATAWLVIAYFAAALAIDLVFTGAAFCKYVCPIGQFSFTASTVSPLALQVRRPETCRTCRTVDCIKGRRDQAAPHAISQRGCELALFLPSKVGNMDCTFCLDCVQACPHDNVALSVRVPALELIDPGRRSGIGRFPKRWDIAALACVFVFAGLVNAFGMTSSAPALGMWLSRQAGVASEPALLAVLFAAGLVAAPIVLLGSAAVLGAWLAGVPVSSSLRSTPGYVYSLVPLGFSVWLSHYGFHLLTGALTIVPVTQSAAMDLLGWPALGAPLWRWTGMQPGAVFPLEAGVILLGAMGSLGLAYLVSEREHAESPLAATIPWAIVTIALTAAAVWILAQPMDMRGIGAAG